MSGKSKAPMAHSPALLVHKPGHREHASVIRTLRAAGYRTTSLETDRLSAVTAARVASRLQRNMLVVVLGGDGTASAVANAILAEPHASNVTFLPLRGGNANDIAHMLNGSATLQHMLQTGHGVHCKPLEITIHTPEGITYTVWALAYFSVGASAVACAALEKIKRRSGWLKYARMAALYEMLATWHAFGSGRSFRLTDNSGSRTIADLVFFRGERTAKYGKPHASLFANHYEQLIMTHPGHQHALRSMLSLATGSHSDNVTGKPYSFTVKADGATLPIQFDGEVQYIPSGSQITISIARRSYQTLSIKT